ncbi:hypothetical protein P153DRAFT_297112, partial [Dothidotthia symphoricarpi CBS 119687]
QPCDKEQPACFNPEANDKTEYAVKRIKDYRVNRRMVNLSIYKKGLLQYLVRWANYLEGNDNPLWEPYVNIIKLLDMVHDYY